MDIKIDKPSDKTEFLFASINNDKYKFIYALARLICKTICVISAMIYFKPNIIGGFLDTIF